MTGPVRTGYEENTQVEHWQCEPGGSVTRTDMMTVVRSRADSVWLVSILSEPPAQSPLSTTTDCHIPYNTYGGLLTNHVQSLSLYERVDFLITLEKWIHIKDIKDESLEERIYVGTCSPWQCLAPTQVCLSVTSPTWDRPRQSLVTGAGEILASWSYVSQECVRPSHPARHISLPPGPGAWALGCQHKNTLDTGEILTQRQRMNGPMADGWGLPHNGNIFNRSINLILSSD